MQLPPGPPPPPEPTPETKYLPGVKVTAKLWDNGSFQTPTWMQFIVRCEVTHLEESNYLNHYLSIRYRIYDAHYIFWPNPTLPENDEPWFEYKNWYRPPSVGLIDLGDADNIIVVWNLMLSPGTPQFDLIRDYQGVEVQAELLGSNGPDFGIEELHEMAQDTRKYELGHTMFGAPENPADHISTPPGGIVVNDP